MLLLHVLIQFLPRHHVLMLHRSLQIWEGRPATPSAPAFPHPLDRAGQSSAEKVLRIQQQMEKEGCGYLVVAALDELAWLFNIRGSDVAYNPVWCASR